MLEPTATPFDVAQDLYQRGEYRALVEQFASNTSLDAASRQLCAQAFGRLGQRRAAACLFTEAARLHAGDRSHNASICAANAVAMLASEGMSQLATMTALESLLFPAECGLQDSTLQNAFKATMAAGDSALLIATICAGSTFAATREVCLRTLLDIADKPASYGISSPTPARHSAAHKADDGLISFIVCSNDDDRFVKFGGECAEAMADAPYEIIRIADATSMVDGYGRGMRSACGAYLVFCHDDIEFLGADIAPSLRMDLQDADVLVSVGGRELIGPTWFSCGPLGLVGWMCDSTAGGVYNVSIAGVPDRRVTLATGDGCFIAARRGVATSVGWDGPASTGFHLYDLDFCARAHDAGYRIAATRHVALNHLSGGNYGAEWRRAAEHFLRVRHIDGFALAANPWITAGGYDRQDAARICRSLAHLVSPGWHHTIERQLERLSSLLRPDIADLQLAVSSCL